MATASGITEFLIELYFFPQLKSWGWINKIGLVMVIVGQVARTLAMFSAKSNFSHHVEYYKEEHHVLVTGGIYRYVSRDAVYFHWIFCVFEFVFVLSAFPLFFFPFDLDL